MEDHDKDSKKEGLPVCGHVVWVADRSGGKYHSGYAIVHFFPATNQHQLPRFLIQIQLNNLVLT